MICCGHGGNTWCLFKDMRLQPTGLDFWYNSQRVKSLEPGSKRINLDSLPQIRRVFTGRFDSVLPIPITWGRVLGLRMCSSVERFWTVSNPPERRLSCCFSNCCLHMPLFNCCRRYERFGKILFRIWFYVLAGAKKASPTEGAYSLVELRIFCLKIFFIDDFVTTDQCQLLVGSGLLLYQ